LLSQLLLLLLLLLQQIGEYMQEQIEEYFKQQGRPVTVKYIDPSYMIR
jgi:hypothetical protein